jgi:hypothetical protein
LKIIILFFVLLQISYGIKEPTFFSMEVESGMIKRFQQVKGEQQKYSLSEKVYRLTPTQAIKLVKKYLGIQKSEGLIIEYDHTDEKGHYVIHVYTLVLHDSELMEGHTVTYGWYEVDPINGGVYEINF